MWQYAPLGRCIIVIAIIIIVIIIIGNSLVSLIIMNEAIESFMKL